MFDPNEPVARASGAAYQFVPLRLQGCSIAVLGVLDHEYHQEGDNGGRGIYYKLPSIGESKYRSANHLQDNQKKRQDKGQRLRSEENTSNLRRQRTIWNA